jgi:hypothetical protein
VPRLRDARFCLAVFAAALLPTAYVEALPAPAGASAPPSVPCPSTAANEAAAVRAAAACKGRVEVMSARDEKLRVFANANGSLTAESAATVQRVRDSAGNWIKPDAQLRRDADGRIRPATTSLAMTFSGGNTGDQVIIRDLEAGLYF